MALCNAGWQLNAMSNSTGFEVEDGYMVYYGSRQVTMGIDRPRHEGSGLVMSFERLDPGPQDCAYVGLDARNEAAQQTLHVLVTETFMLDLEQHSNSPRGLMLLWTLVHDLQKRIPLAKVVPQTMLQRTWILVLGIFTQTKSQDPT